MQAGIIQTFAAIVDEVDEAKGTCVVSYSERKIIRVRLRSIIEESDAGLTCIPVIGSSVLVTLINNSFESAFVSCFSAIAKLIFVNESGYRFEITDEFLNAQIGENIFKIDEEQIYAEVGESTLTMTEDKIQMNDGSLNGLVKIDTLKQELDKNSQILQGLLTILSGAPIPEPGMGSPSALQTALAGAVAGKQPGQWNDIENDKVTHG